MVALFMTDHISTEQMAEFRARTLGSKEFAAAAGHLAHCEICRERFRGVSREQKHHAFSVTDLSLEHWLKDEHFDSEQLVAYADGALDNVTQEMADAHLKTCVGCREELRRFLEYKRRIEPWMETETALDASRIFWRPWEWLAPIRKPAFIAATVIVIALVLVSLLLFRNSKIGIDRIATSSPTPAHSISPSVSPSTGASVAVQTTTPDASPSPSDLIASLRDNGNEVAIDTSGRLSGLEGLTPQLEQSIKEALLAKELKRPGVISDLDGMAGPLRGADVKLKFRLIAPTKTVLADERPSFEWEPLNDATGYRVFIGDLKHRETVISEPLPATTTRWTPSAPLKRGRVYSWAVTATVNGQEITSPGASAPEWKFKILDESKARELAALKRRPQSHLALGIFYANAGMTAEAERELQMLALENPRSPIADRLLRAVRSWR
jgi:predicted anti-sigma-YlaC factor YlaD